MRTPDEMLADVISLDGGRYLSQWEAGFIRSLKSIAKANKRPTLNQRESVRRMHQKYFNSQGERR